MYLLSNIALYYCAGWLVSLLYDYINYGFGTIDYSYQTSWLPDSMRWAMASLVIVFPVYIWVTNRLNRDVDANPGKRELWVRKWLMYLTLALASVAIVVDLVALVNQFLSGEFAATFFLKVGAVALVAGMIFAYYIYELRRDANKPAPQRALFRYVAIILVLISVIGGFFLVGSPTTAREKRYDSERTADLQDIQWQIVSYWQRKEVLPVELSDLNDSISGYSLPVDPKTGLAYEYSVIDGKTFELCTTFDRPSTGQEFKPAPFSGPYESQEFANWNHEAGRICFERTIDSQLYPPTKVVR